MIALISTVSLIILIATAVLVYKMLVTSKEFLSADKFSPLKLLKARPSGDKFYRQSLAQLNSKIKSLEDSNAYYEIQFSRLQLQMNSGQNIQPKSTETLLIAQINQEEEEDWKEMYYQENEQKVQMENELDQALQALEQQNQKFLDQEEKNENLRSLRSNYDARLIEIKSMQKKLDSLEKKLEAATERENNLVNLLQKEIDLKKIYAKIENENVRLRSETEDQKRQLTEFYAKEKEYSKQLTCTSELQSRLGLYEDEKIRKMDELKRQMENNRIFSK